MKENLKTWFKSFFSQEIEEKISHSIEIDLIDKEIEKFSGINESFEQLIERSKKWNDNRQDEENITEIKKQRRLSNEALVKEIQNYPSEALDYYKKCEKKMIELGAKQHHLPRYLRLPHEPVGSLDKYSDESFQFFSKIIDLNLISVNLEKEITTYAINEEKIFSNEFIKDYLNIDNKDKLSQNKYDMTERHYENRHIIQQLHSLIDHFKDLEEVIENHKSQFKSHEVAETYSKVIKSEIANLKEHFEPLIKSAFMINMLRYYNKAYEEKYVNNSQQNTTSPKEVDVILNNTYKIPEINIESMKDKIQNIRSKVNLKNLGTQKHEKP